MAPWDGSENYQYPLGTPGIPDTTIESNKYNTFLDDIVANDLNKPRPIHRGGTAGTSALTARLNLKTEVALTSPQAIVTDYLSQVWENGSFQSAAGAVNSPDGVGAATNVYWGTCLTDGINVMLEARNINDDKKYYRRKSGSPLAWTAWYLGTETAGNGGYVLKVGDTMSGNLNLTYADPTFYLTKAAGTNVAQFYAFTGASVRWLMRISDSDENFRLYPYDNAGVVRPAALAIDRLTGAATFNGNVAVGNALSANAMQGATLNLTGAASIVGNASVGGNVDVGGWMRSQNGTLYLGTGGYYINLSSATFTFNGHIQSSANISASGNIAGQQISGTLGVFSSDIQTAESSGFAGGTTAPGNADLRAPNGSVGARTAFIGAGYTDYYNVLGGGNRGGWSVMADIGWDSGAGWQGLALRNYHFGLDGTYILFSGSSNETLGWIQGNGNGTLSYISSSDATLKEDVRDLRETVDSLDLIRRLTARSFKFKAADKHTVGLIAQEVNEVLGHGNNVVVEGKNITLPGPDGKDRTNYLPWGISYGDLVPYLIDAIGTLTARIEELEARK